MSEIVLSANSLVKKFGDRTAVDHFSLSLKAGEVVGLLGPNGAGKSTLVGMLYGAVIPDEGSVEVCGFDVRKNPKEVKRHLGVVTQDNLIDGELSVFENLYQFGRYCGLSSREAKTRADFLLEDMQLSEKRDSLPRTLSGGKCRTMLLATVLMHDPAILFLDEPTTGLDPDARQSFWRVVLSLRAKGKTVLLTTHYMDEVERLCDRIVLLQGGRAIDEGTSSDLVSRIVGQEVIEVSGVKESEVRTHGGHLFTWITPFSDGILGTPVSDSLASIEKELAQLAPSRTVRRRANLDDVFLRLTGRELSHE